MINDGLPFPYVKYDLPNGKIVLLTPRPDAYTIEAVNKFTDDFKPTTRFQFTDDLVKYSSGPKFHWYPWMPSQFLPLELVYAAIVLMSKALETEDVLWLHCDSSSMRAPTFFGMFLRTHFNDQKEKICADTKWTDGRQVSCPLEYSQISFNLDKHMQDFIDAWTYYGPNKAYEWINSTTKRRD